MCGGIHYRGVEGLVSVERWSCSRGASCVVEHDKLFCTILHTGHDIDLPIGCYQTNQASPE